jgi:hypothetical protein
MKPHTVLLRGGIWGWDGPTSSAGIDKLADLIEPLGPTYVFNWSNWRDPLNVINGLKDAAIVVLIGYSGGGMMVPWLCKRTIHVVDLAIGMDPSPREQVDNQVVRAKEVICYYNESPMFFGLGGGKYANRDQTVRTISQNHLNVQWNRDIWNEIVADVKALSPPEA